MRDDGARYALDAAAAARWCAPEMTAALAEHARTAAITAGDDDALLAAAGWALHGRAALGEAVPGAIRALETLGEPPSGDSATTGPLLLGLAAAAREVGEHDIAWQLLRAVLDGVGTPDELRADALIEAVRLELTRGDAELDELADAARRATRSCGGAAEGIRLGMIDVAAAAAERRSGCFARAADRARDALSVLTSGDELLPTAPHVAAALSLELVRALIDNNLHDDALDTARGVLAWPERAGTVERLGWLRLAIAGSDGRIVDEESAVASLETAVRSCAARELPQVEAACHTRLAELYEARRDLEKALAAARGAQSAERRRAADRERYRLQLAQSAGILTDPLSVPPRPWDARRDDRVHATLDDLADLAPDGAEPVGEVVDEAAEDLGVPTDDDQASEQPDETPSEVSFDLEPELDERPVEPHEDQADEPSITDRDTAPDDTEDLRDRLRTPVDHHAKRVRGGPGLVVLITVAAREGRIPLDAVHNGLAKLRPSIEARLPLEAKLVCCDGDVVALLPGTDRSAAEDAMRGLCAELDELCPYLADELADVVFHAEVAEHIGDPARLEGMVTVMRASGTAQPADLADLPGSAGTAGGDLAGGRPGQPGDTPLGAEQQDADGAPSTDSDTVVDLDQRQKRRELTFAELLAGALAAYREA